MAVARLLVPVLVCVLALTVAGQAPSSSNARYTLRGSVINSVTGEPVRKALVEATGAQVRRGFTGPDGQFQFADLPRAEYIVQARRPGFVDWNGASSPGFMGATGNYWFRKVTLGPDTEPVVIKLIPQASLSGRVVDSEAEPVANLSIQCLQQSIVAGHKRWQAMQTVSTDDTGNFSIDNLPPGKVLLATSQQQVYPGLIADDEASRLIYPKQYYPNSPDLSSAQTIDLAPGQDAQAEISITAVRGIRIFFSVVPPQPWVQATLSDASGDRVESQVRRNIRGGGWILPSVPPGSWRLSVDSNAGDHVSGEANIDVGGADLRNVVVALSPAVQVPLVISGGHANSGGSGPPVSVQVIPVSPAPGGGTYIPVNQDSRTFVGVVPGNYHVAVTSTGADCVDSIMAGAADLTRSEYVVTSGTAAPPIDVGLRSDCASLEIATAQNATQPATAVIAGGPHTLEPQVLFTGGSVTAKLAPGEYDVFAFANLNSIEYANPDVLKSFAGQHVSLSPNQSATVHLELINPSEHQ